MTKSALRHQFLAQRRALSAEDVASRSRAIAERLFGTFLADTKKLTIVHTFLPIARQNEVDTWPIVHRIWQDFTGVRVAIPVTDVATNQLAHYVITSETSLIENRWGIPEPEPGNCPVIGSQLIDVVLVPLLAFDTHGHRVGHGKGYYDRFLAECRPDCLKIGLSLFEPVEQIDDVEPTDVQLDACITPERVHFF